MNNQQNNVNNQMVDPEHLPEDTINFKIKANQVRPSDPQKVEKIKEILMIHRHQGANIILFVEKKISPRFKPVTDVCKQLISVWHFWLSEADCDSTPQIKIYREGNSYRVDVETYPDGGVEVPYTHLFDEVTVDEIIRMLMSTGHIYDAYQFRVY